MAKEVNIQEVSSAQAEEMIEKQKGLDGVTPDKYAERDFDAKTDGKVHVVGKPMTKEEVVEHDAQKLMELDDDARDILIQKWNEKAEGIAEIVPEKPTEEEQEQFKKELMDYEQEYKQIPFVLATGKEKSLEVGEFLQEWNENHAAALKDYWKGMLAFRKVIAKKLEALKNGETEDLSVEYGPLTYLNDMMLCPIVVGCKEAEWMLEHDVVYNETLNKVGEGMNLLKLIYKKIALLNIRWSLSMTGFKMNILLEELSDYEKINPEQLQF